MSVLQIIGFKEDVQNRLKPIESLRDNIDARCVRMTLLSSGSQLLTSTTTIYWHVVPDVTICLLIHDDILGHVELLSSFNGVLLLGWSQEQGDTFILFTCKTDGYKATTILQSLYNWTDLVCAAVGTILQLFLLGYYGTHHIFHITGNLYTWYVWLTVCLRAFIQMVVSISWRGELGLTFFLWVYIRRLLSEEAGCCSLDHPPHRRIRWFIFFLLLLWMAICVRGCVCVPFHCFFFEKIFKFWISNHWV